MKYLSMFLVLLLPLITESSEIDNRLNNITSDLYERIINSAAEGKLYVDFSVDIILLKNKLQPQYYRNKVLNILEEMFPNVKYSHYGMNKFGYINYRASWKPDDYIDYNLEL